METKRQNKVARLIQKDLSNIFQHETSKTRRVFPISEIMPADTPDQGNTGERERGQGNPRPQRGKGLPKHFPLGEGTGNP